MNTWGNRFFAVLLGLAALAAPASAANVTIEWDPSPDPQEAVLAYRVYARNVLLGETGGLVWTLPVSPGETLTIGVSTVGYYDADGDGLRETLGESNQITITHIVAPPPTEICDNGVDDDLDGHVDESCAWPVPPPATCIPPGQIRRADDEQHRVNALHADDSAGKRPTGRPKPMTGCRGREKKK